MKGKIFLRAHFRGQGLKLSLKQEQLCGKFIALPVLFSWDRTRAGTGGWRLERSSPKIYESNFIQYAFVEFGK